MKLNAIIATALLLSACSEEPIEIPVQPSPMRLNGIYLSGGTEHAKLSRLQDCYDGYHKSCRIASPDKFIGVKITDASITFDEPDTRYSSLIVKFDDIPALATQIAQWLDDPADDVIEAGTGRITRYHPISPIQMQGYGKDEGSFQFTQMTKDDWIAVKGRIADAKQFRDDMM